MQLRDWFGSNKRLQKQDTIHLVVLEYVAYTQVHVPTQCQKLQNNCVVITVSYIYISLSSFPLKEVTWHRYDRHRNLDIDPSCLSSPQRRAKCVRSLCVKTQGIGIFRCYFLLA